MLTSPFLSIRNLSKSFNNLKVIEQINFDVIKGEIFGIIGPNGAGKTTLFGILSGFHTADKGEVYFNNELISDYKPYKIVQRGIARTFQIVRPLKGLTLIENVMIGAFNHCNSVKEARYHASTLIELLGLSEKAQNLTSSLTLPELKLLEIAKALATKPQVLLLDEVMAGLRPSEIDALLLILHQEINQKLGITLVLIEHHMRAVMSLSTRIMVLNQGKKIAEGTPKEIVIHPDVIRTYIGS